MGELHAIETKYKGYRFRSRLEARWAVFLDSLGVAWDFETEGFSLPTAGNYLPDFWLEREEIWVEIKGRLPSDEERRKCFELACVTGHSVVIVCGSPKGSWESGYDAGRTRWLCPQFSIQTFHGWRIPSEERFPFDAWWAGELFNAEGHSSLYEFLTDLGYELPEPPAVSSGQILEYVTADRAYYLSRYGVEHPKWKHGICGKDNSVFHSSSGLCFDVPGIHKSAAAIDRALMTARSARFEHGEVGAARG